MKVCAGSPDTSEVHLCANLWSPLSQCLYLRKKYHIIIYRGLVLGGVLPILNFSFGSKILNILLISLGKHCIRSLLMSQMISHMIPKFSTLADIGSKSVTQLDSLGIVWSSRKWLRFANTCSHPSVYSVSSPGAWCSCAYSPKQL